MLGRMHLYGNLVPKDEAKGVELVRAAAQSSAPAQSILGGWIAIGERGFEKNEQVAATAPFAGKAMNAGDITEQARKSTVQLECTPR
jgi:TPR repeat protein